MIYYIKHQFGDLYALKYIESTSVKCTANTNNMEIIVSITENNFVHVIIINILSDLFQKFQSHCQIILLYLYMLYMLYVIIETQSDPSHPKILFLYILTFLFLF